MWGPRFSYHSVHSASNTTVHWLAIFEHVGAAEEKLANATRDRTCPALNNFMSLEISLACRDFRVAAAGCVESTPHKKQQLGNAQPFELGGIRSGLRGIGGGGNELLKKGYETRNCSSNQKNTFENVI